MTKNPQYRIFINYRWEDTGNEANLLRDYIEQSLDQKLAVFQDKRVEEGKDWAEEIEHCLDQAEIVLVLIGPQWFTIDKQLSKYKKVRWLDYEHCWVRKEIEISLTDSGKTILPILVKNAHWPKSEADAQEAFPPSILPIHRLKPFEIDFNNHFERDVQPLIQAIRKVLAVDEEKTTNDSKVAERKRARKSNLLVHFPLPLHLQRELPASETPYIGLEYFKENDARLFFGRNREILRLWQICQYPSCKIIFLYGYSGVGKSSLLHAGFMPRVRQRGWRIEIQRRDKNRGLKAQLMDMLSGQSPDNPQILIVDQVEEAITDPDRVNLPDELPAFFDFISTIGESRPKTKVILSFRKEFLAEMEAALKERNMQAFDLLLKPLERNSILEAIEGVFHDKELKLYYKDFEMEPGLSEAICRDIMQDSHLDMPGEVTGRAPLLQMQLFNLWKMAAKEPPIELSIQLYKRIRKSSLAEQLEAQMERLAQDNFKQGKFREASKQGLVLDVLHFFTTSQSTSRTHPEEFVLTKYAGLNKERAGFIFSLLLALQDLHLLRRVSTNADGRAFRLAHDSWAPLIQEAFRDSVRAGQRAWHLVENKWRDMQRGLDPGLFNKDDLSIIEEGSNSMRLIPSEIKSLLNDSRTALEEQMKIRQSNFEFSMEKFESNIKALKYNEAMEQAQKLYRMHHDPQAVSQCFQELAFYYKWVQDRPKLEEALKGLGMIKGKNWQTAALHVVDQDINLVQNIIKEVNQDDYQSLEERYFPKLLPVEGGTFNMGSEAFGNERTVHEVRLSNFRIAQTPTTYWQFNLYCQAKEIDIARHTPSWGTIGNHPVVNVSWYDAIGYANWISEQSGLEPSYEIDKEKKDPNNNSELDNEKWKVSTIEGSNGFRLPTEAEWEFAARGGKAGRSSGCKYAGSNEIDEVAWYRKNSKSTMPVRQKKPNELGLFDMSGNVREWCWDWYDEKYHRLYKGWDLFNLGLILIENPTLSNVNPTGPTKGKRRVLRGGSWIDFDFNCEVFFRNYDIPYDWYSLDGFRLSRGFKL